MHYFTAFPPPTHIFPRHPPFFPTASMKGTREDRGGGFATLGEQQQKELLGLGGEEQAKITLGWEEVVGHLFLFGWIHLDEKRQNINFG